MGERISVGQILVPIVPENIIMNRVATHMMNVTTCLIPHFLSTSLITQVLQHAIDTFADVG